MAGHFLGFRRSGGCDGKSPLRGLHSQAHRGLDQNFNSLDAQREACENCIASQKSEGWLMLSDRYDDSGFSGGNLDRPGLKRLPDEIKRGLVNTIVV